MMGGGPATAIRAARAIACGIVTGGFRRAIRIRGADQPALIIVAVAGHATELVDRALLFTEAVIDHRIRPAIGINRLHHAILSVMDERRRRGGPDTRHSPPDGGVGAVAVEIVTRCVRAQYCCIGPRR